MHLAAGLQGQADTRPIASTVLDSAEPACQNTSLPSHQVANHRLCYYSGMRALLATAVLSAKPWSFMSIDTNYSPVCMPWLDLQICFHAASHLQIEHVAT